MTTQSCERMKSLPTRSELLLLAAVTVLAWVLAGDSPAHASASTERAHATKVIYCTRHKRPRGCIDIPKHAQRPRGVDQQGSRALTPKDVVNGGGLGGGPDADRSALTWARSQRRLAKWAWRCERFVEEAYGTRGRFDTAADAAAALPLTRSPITDAPAGALVYFKADRANRGYGHVGLSLGGGKMLSALAQVTVTDVAHDRYWRSIYLGWTPAPDAWPGRIPPAPGPTTIDPEVTVRITAPAVGQAISGTIDLTAAATGAGGVAFDAYYATDPLDADTRRWVHLGTAKRKGDYWTYSFDSTQLPDQGYTPWGTVNIAAVALNARGSRTGTIDYRRLTIDNSTDVPARPMPATTPTPTPQPTPSPMPTGIPETTGGATGTWTDYKSASGEQGAEIPSFTTVDVRCRVEGLAVEDGNVWWYRLVSPPWSERFYASADAFYNNGAISGPLAGTPFFDSAVPLC
jgi:hypothetical protein